MLLQALLQAFCAQEQLFELFPGQWLSLGMGLEILRHSGKRCLVLFRYGLKEFEEFDFFIRKGLAIIGACFVLRVSGRRGVCHFKSSWTAENLMILTAPKGSNLCPVSDRLRTAVVA